MSERKGEELSVLALASTPVISVAEGASLADAVRLMAEKGYRRLPVVDPDTGELRGIITATDILGFLVAGPKHELMVEKHGDDLAAALSEPVSSIAVHAVSIEVGNSVLDALELMAAEHVGGLPVVDAGGHLWAIITERDLVKALAGRPTGARVAELMTPSPVSIRPEASLREAVELMVGRGYRRLPVVGADGRLLGIITSMDIIRLLHAAVGEGRLGPELLDTRVGDACTRPAISVEPGDDVGRAAQLMWEHRIGGLLVVEPRTGKLVGIITERDFFKLLLG